MIYGHTGIDGAFRLSSSSSPTLASRWTNHCPPPA